MKIILVITAAIAGTYAMALNRADSEPPRVMPLFGSVGRGLDISDADNAVLAAQMTFCAAGATAICENGCCPASDWVCCGGEFICASTIDDCLKLEMLVHLNSTAEAAPAEATIITTKECTVETQVEDCGDNAVCNTENVCECNGGFEPTGTDDFLCTADEE